MVPGEVGGGGDGMSTMSDGKTYIVATRHAAKVLIDGMNWETKEVRRLQDALEVVEEIGSMNSWIGFVGQEHPSEEDRAMIDQYLALQRETGRGDPRSIEIVLRKRLEVHEEARAVLAGALLQIGRQGISRVHEGLEELSRRKRPQGAAAEEGCLELPATSRCTGKIAIGTHANLG